MHEHRSLYLTGCINIACISDYGSNESRNRRNLGILKGGHATFKGQNYEIIFRRYVNKDVSGRRRLPMWRG